MEILPSSSLYQSYLRKKEELPPPMPLINKTFKPSPSAVHIGEHPFLYSIFRIPYQFKGKEKVCEQNLYCPQPVTIYSDGTKLSDVFSTNLIYIRYESLSKIDNFNMLTYDLLFASRLKTKISKMKNNKAENNKVVEFFQLDESDALIFESRFESGNLTMVSQVSRTEYNLLIQNDVNTLGNTQWFYFSVSNAVASTKVRLNLINMCKSTSLFQDGMSICIYSEKRQANTGEGWYRGGENITYSKNNINREGKNKSYYTLSFEYTFEYSYDLVFFSYSIPYTYTDLIKLLDSYEVDRRISQFYARKTICKSIGGNNIYSVTITHPCHKEEILKKKVIIITARVHPGETVSSYIMQGILKFLTSESIDSELLRKKFIFKIIPMLNPDGVINGNYRCSLSGVDLNRRWNKPSVRIHPEIFHTKHFIETIASKYTLGLVIDLHGHSINKNIFMYGCNYEEAPHLCKVFPYMLSKSSEYFSYQDCRFVMQKSKEKTFRITLFKLLNVSNVYTLEASFCGGSIGKYKDIQYTSNMLYDFAAHFCNTLFIMDDCLYILSNLTPEVYKNYQDHTSFNSLGKVSTPVKNSRRIGIVNLPIILNEFITNSELLRSGEEEEDDGSDSDRSEDNISEDEVFKKLRQIRKKKKKTDKVQFDSKLLMKSNMNSISSKSLPRLRCKNCGKFEFPGHQCLSPKPTSKLILNYSPTKLQIRSQKNQYSPTPISSTNSFNKNSSEKLYSNRFQAINNNTFGPTPERPLVNVESSYKLNSFDEKTVNKSKSNERAKIEFKLQYSKSPVNGPHLLGIIEGIGFQTKHQDTIGFLALKNKKSQAL